MDKHEKGIEIDRTRTDTPLPRWNGRYGGDPKRLPRVIQKLLHRRALTAEEKAELLWRFYELDQAARGRRRALWATLIVFCALGYFTVTHWNWVLSQVELWINPPPK